MTNANRRMPLPDLLLAQLEKRLLLAARPVRHPEAEEALSEVIVYVIVLGIIVTFCLTVWALGGD
ncbi:MAG: hypothetical protein ACREJQ_04610 [bacterium]